MFKVLYKIFNMFLVVAILITLLPINIYALDYEEYKMGIVASTLGNGVIVRNGPGTTHSKVDGFADGKIVTIVGEADPDDKTNSSCTKWYKISYNDTNAYVCADLINIIELQENPDYDYETELAKFPESYKPYIEDLHKIYPNAMFIASYATNKDGTNMDFKTAVNNENILGKSLLWDSNNSRNGLKSLDSYVFSSNSFANNYSGGGVNWYAASYDTIAYYMDPRNFLNEKRVFMFEAQAYNPALHTISGIESILKGSFMYNATVDNTEVTFAEAIMAGAVNSGVSPYFLASRIIQEVGTTRSSLVKGTYEAYPEFNGYYNYFNIGASGNNVVYNGLLSAKNKGWDSEYKAIVEGSKWIGNGYISAGQDTGYYQKWDIQCSGRSSCYSHQYMQNIEAPYTESYNTYSAYLKNSSTMYLNPYLFTIPIYENMPDKTSLPNSGNPINYLSSITINNNLIPNFNSLTYTYNIEVPYNLDTLTVAATPLSPKAKVSGTGNIKLTEDSQKIVIKVTAENGSVKEYIINVTKNKNMNIEMTLDEAISKIQGVRLSDTTISGVTSADALKEKVNNTATWLQVSITNKNGEIANGNLGTGYKVNFSLNGESKNYDVVIYGDTNGDADITILDLLRIQKQLLKSITFSNLEYSAGDVNKDGEITILDLLLMQKHLLGSKYIEQ